MAAENFGPALAHVLRHEGGYADHPADPGGATMMGITQATLASWRGHPVSKADVRSISRDEVASIYRARYWNAIGGDQLPGGLDLAVFDYAVNSGPARAARTLQGIAGTQADGVVGRKTLEAISRLEPRSTILALCAARRSFLRHLPTAPVFGRGWLHRVSDIEKESIRLLAKPSRPNGRADGSSSQTRPGISAASQENSMDITKTFFQSRTVWANIIGFGCLVLSLLGFRTGDLDVNLLTDRVLEMIAAGSFVASTVFRIIATKRLN
ncbi:zliS Lysozyme family protein [Rhabdaerophilaceae bacterium]